MKFLVLSVLFVILMEPGPGGAAQDPPDLDKLAQNASCLIEAQTVVKLSSQAQGILSAVNVTRGDRVKAGDVVATLESGVEEAMLKAARMKASTDALVSSKKTELDIAESKLARQEGLKAKNIATLQTLEQAQTDVATLQSELSQAELDKQLSAIEADRIAASLERRVMRSPINGIVVSVDRATGEYADLNTLIATLADIQPLKVKLYLPLAAYPMVHVGMGATVRPLGPVAGAFAAEITTKDQQIDAESNLFQAQLKLPNPEAAIPAGLRCVVSFKHAP